MAYKLLFILVEGDDDERFFKRIIEQFFVDKYSSIRYWQHAQKKGKKIKDFLKSIIKMSAHYLYVEDINQTPCVSEKKQKIKNSLKNIDKDRIIVVIKEIESWYLAGLHDEDSKKFTKKLFKSTDTITKEQFKKFIPKNESRINFMIEILNAFTVDIAKQKNNSFSYFMKKHCN